MIRSLLIIMAASTLWITPVLAADFNHATHLTYIDNADCATCHEEGAEAIKPEGKVCLECHDQAFIDAVNFPGMKTHGPTWALEHRAAAKGQTPDCAACHQQDFCLECHKSGFADEMGDPGNNLSNVHRSDFQVSHPIAARTNPQLCSSCHENNFCVECHEQFAPADLAIESHRKGFTNGTLGGLHASYSDSQCQTCHPGSVLPAHDWSNKHSREARKNLATCQACHPDGDICIKCHSARSGLGVNPHPADWDKIGGRLNRASGGKTCQKCH